MKSLVVTDVRTHFGETLDQVLTTDQPIVIEVDGQKAAVLAPVHDSPDLSADEFADMLWATQAQILSEFEDQNGGPITIGDVDEMIDAGHP